MLLFRQHEGPRRQRRLPRPRRRAGGQRSDRGRGGGGEVLPPQARQAPRGVLDVGAAGAGDEVVPRGGRRAPRRARRRRLLLRPEPRGPARRRRDARRVGGVADALRRARPALPQDVAARGGPRARALRAPPRRPRGLGAPRRGLGRLRGARARRAGRARLAPRGPRARRAPRAARRAAPAGLARPALRGAHRAPRFPPLLRRVQGDGDGLLRAAVVPGRPPRARPRGPRGRLPGGARRVGAVRARARRGRRVHRGPRRPRVLRPATARGGPARPRALVARPHGRARPRDGRRGGAQLRGELASVARGAVRAHLGAARCGRLGDRARRGAARRGRARRRRRADAGRRPRPELGRRGARGLGRGRRDRLRAARRHRRRRRRGARRERRRRVVPGALGVRAARARASLPARGSAPPGEPGEAQRHQGARAVPAGRSDGARRARRPDLRGAAAEPVHALHPRRAAGLGRSHPRGRPRRRDRADPDRRPRARAAGGADARGLRGTHGRPRGGQHEPQHRRPTDGGRPPGRARVLRLLAGGRARHRLVHRAPRRLRGHRRAGARRGRRMTPRYEVVVPTRGRSSLRALLDGLAAGDGPWPERVILVDDRASSGGAPLPVPDLPVPVTVLRGPARGPAAARNAGWRAAAPPWGGVPDGDVVPRAGWRAALAADLAGAGERPGGVQGRIRVPLPADRAPTDWERNVAGLERARWATADMAYRRDALRAAGGFDERFPRAYREDADLGLRVTGAGWDITCGERVAEHPVRPAPARVSLTKQAGNADDVLMRALHGRDWRERAGVPPGRRPRHVAVAAAGASALALAGAARLAPAGAGRLAPSGRRPRRARLPVASLAAGAAWAAGTAELAWARIAPGPRTRREVATMAWTSALMPFAATGWYAAGLLTLRRRLRTGARPAAVLFDRDGTLVVDVPYNGDPDRGEPMPAARPALDKLRAAGIPTGVVSNQSGVARGMLTPDDVERVNRRIEELLGPLGPWAWCPHGPDDGCDCRKPAPGLVLRAASELGVDPAGCVVVGDIGADVEAARAAGARGVLVPTPRTRPEEVAAAPEVARDLAHAVDRLLRA